MPLFGSVARGEANSDVDFLVDLAPGRLLLDHAALMLDLQDLLRRKVEVATERGLRPAVRERIVQELIPL
ncbi:MAG: nucleotidyltransferase domain-containing protein [Candidatus Omnitrophota bacterium]